MIHPDVLARAADIRTRFQSATPFRHVLIESFLERDAAEALLADFPPFDRRMAINEHGEIGRKAVNETVAGISPFYASFYRYINAPAFTEAISALTGIPDLIADETLFGGGTHENLDGQGLDLHVDFNIDERRMLHRRINLLLYLNKEWETAWGGSIELHADPWDATNDEIRSFLPLFNHAVLFETSERSWHGFSQIALPADRKALSRKSFSIYLYTKERPAEETVAPHTTFYVPRPLPAHLRAGRTLTDQDEVALAVAIANRDGLLRMYQKLLVEKEQRLRDLIPIRAGEIALSPRTWRMIMRLHGVKHRLVSLRRKLTLQRSRPAR